MRNQFRFLTPIFICLLFMFALVVCDKPAKTEEEHSHDKPAAEMKGYQTNVLEVKGTVANPLKLTIDSLKQMNVVNLDSFKVVCQTGAVTSDNIWFKGVLLKDVLTKAKIIQENHKDRNFYIVARATDNYMATFSWAEIFNNETGNKTFIVYEENGAPIPKGDFVLETTNDIATGPRHVYWLKSIEVYKVD
ncbi:MAG: molybdopterin-dependent oxidoreductase [Cyclobacteriaceae bacterium]